MLITRKAGWGVALCVRKPGDVRFFVAHSQPDQRQAIAMARAQAQAYAAKFKLPVSICAAPWNAQAPADAEAPPEEPGWVRSLMGKLRMMITCDPSLRPMSTEAIAAEEGRPAAQQSERARMNESGPDGRRPCLDRNYEEKLHGPGGSVGVRG